LTLLKKKVDKLFSNPALLNFVRNILERDFKVPKKIIVKELDRDKKTLDIGCGTGEHSILFNPEGYHGIDISKSYINNAKKNFKVNFSVMDAQKLKFPNDSFDNILIFGILHHLSDEVCDNVLKEAKRVAKDSAKILIMEDIPTKSRYNIIGKIVHYFDAGTNIRKIDSYRKLISKYFTIKKELETISGVCDYCAFVSQNKR